MSSESDVDQKARHREDPAARELEVQGVRVPRLGLGTWQLTGRACEEGVRDALGLGYRHIDTARMYGNEVEVGRGLAASGVARDDVWLTTKIWPTDFRPADLERACADSLRRLGTDHVDLLLLHWPNPEVPLGETLGALVRLREQGCVRQVGVSNFSAQAVEEALDHAPVFCNQVEYHPHRGQPELLRQARERDLLLTAYSPLGHGRLLREPVLREVGEAHGKTAAQVALRWLLDQPQVAAVPKAGSHERRAENLDVYDFELSEEERSRIAHLGRGERTANPRGLAPDWD